MLVLSRKLNEKIVIDGNIVVTIVKVDRNTVRLGIEAPREVQVRREELVRQTLEEAETEDCNLDTEPQDYSLVFQAADSVVIG